MARAAAVRWGALVRAGMVVSNTPAAVPEGFELIVAGHPTPNASSETAGRRALELARSMDRRGTLVVLLSGGASALLAAPAAGVTLNDKRVVTQTMMHAGADIRALNAVRKHLSDIKGGQLGASARGACLAFAVSDVVGDDPSVIGSGPTVPDPTTFADALALLKAFGGLDRYPASIVDRFSRGASGSVPETPKGGDPRLSRTTTHVIGSRVDAMDGAAEEARRRGYHTATIPEPVVGEARIAARRQVEVAAARAASMARPACVVSSGETVVTVKGDGRGGRNQEFALASALALPWNPAGTASPILCAAASIGTDGIDGPTDAAGAVVDSATVDRGRRLGLDPGKFLDRNDSYAFFAALGDLIHTGPTDTNVGDLQIFLLA
jgi:glycerate-2-kinase